MAEEEEVYMTPEEVAEEEIARYSEGRRQERDHLLKESDWVTARKLETGADIPEEWATYRQALRDITTHPDWPFIRVDPAWPTKP
jgi:hypothetical protein